MYYRENGKIVGGEVGGKAGIEHYKAGGKKDKKRRHELFVMWVIIVVIVLSLGLFFLAKALKTM